MADGALRLSAYRMDRARFVGVGGRQHQRVGFRILGDQSLASSAWIHLNSNSTNYFTFRWVKRFDYPVSGTNGYGADDAGLGVGFASGSASSSAFIGIGITRSVKQYTYAGTGYTNLAGTADIGDTPYITAGTLGQAGYPGHPGDSGGPYYVQAYAGDGSGAGVMNQCEGYTGNSYPIIHQWRHLYVGRQYGWPNCDHDGWKHGN